jgi:transposase
MKTQQLHPRTWREERRLRAWELKRAGWRQRDIAEALGISPGAVSKWIAAADKGGRRALQARPIPGRPPRITDAQ